MHESYSKFQDNIEDLFVAVRDGHICSVSDVAQVFKDVVVPISIGAALNSWVNTLDRYDNDHCNSAPSICCRTARRGVVGCGTKGSCAGRISRRMASCQRRHQQYTGSLPVIIYLVVFDFDTQFLLPNPVSLYANNYLAVGFKLYE